MTPWGCRQSWGLRSSDRSIRLPIPMPQLLFSILLSETVPIVFMRRPLGKRSQGKGSGDGWHCSVTTELHPSACFSCCRKRKFVRTSSPALDSKWYQKPLIPVSCYIEQRTQLLSWYSTSQYLCHTRQLQTVLFRYEHPTWPIGWQELPPHMPEASTHLRPLCSGSCE